MFNHIIFKSLCYQLYILIHNGIENTCCLIHVEEFHKREFYGDRAFVRSQDETSYLIPKRSPVYIHVPITDTISRVFFIYIFWKPLLCVILFLCPFNCFASTMALFAVNPPDRCILCTKGSVMWKGYLCDFPIMCLLFQYHIHRPQAGIHISSTPG